MKGVSNLNVEEEEGGIEGVNFLDKETEEHNREILDPNPLYLESCATYHSAFVYWYLNNIKKSRIVLHGHCNAGTTLTDKKEYFRTFEMWLNKKGIANVMPILQLEETVIVLHMTNKYNG